MQTYLHSHPLFEVLERFALRQVRSLQQLRLTLIFPLSKYEAQTSAFGLSHISCLIVIHY